MKKLTLFSSFYFKARPYESRSGEFSLGLAIGFPGAFITTWHFKYLPPIQMPGQWHYKYYLSSPGELMSSWYFCSKFKDNFFGKWYYKYYLSSPGELMSSWYFCYTVKKPMSRWYFCADLPYIIFDVDEDDAFNVAKVEYLTVINNDVNAYANKEVFLDVNESLRGLGKQELRTGILHAEEASNINKELSAHVNKTYSDDIQKTLQVYNEDSFDYDMTRTLPTAVVRGESADLSKVLVIRVDEDIAYDAKIERDTHISKSEQYESVITLNTSPAASHADNIKKEVSAIVRKSVSSDMKKNNNATIYEPSDSSIKKKHLSELYTDDNGVTRQFKKVNMHKEALMDKAGKETYLYEDAVFDKIVVELADVNREESEVKSVEEVVSMYREEMERKLTEEVAVDYQEDMAKREVEHASYVRGDIVSKYDEAYLSNVYLDVEAEKETVYNVEAQVDVEAEKETVYNIEAQVDDSASKVNVYGAEMQLDDASSMQSHYATTKNVADHAKVDIQHLSYIQSDSDAAQQNEVGVSAWVEEQQKHVNVNVVDVSREELDATIVREYLTTLKEEEQFDKFVEYISTVSEENIGIVPEEEKEDKLIWLIMGRPSWLHQYRWKKTR